MAEYEVGEERAVLLRSPSVEMWALELRRMLGGERALDLDRLGGGQEYVEVLFAETSDIFLSKNCFQFALATVVAEWRDEDWRLMSSATCLLDLVAAYKPAGGFALIYERLRKVSSFGDGLVDDLLSHVAVGDLRFKALVALEYYFPAPAASPLLLSAFNCYVDLLKDHLQDCVYVSYAAFRLVQLGVLDVQSLFDQGVLFQRQGLIVEFLELSIEGLSQSCRGEVLKSVYLCALKCDDLRSVIEEALGEVGVKLVHGDNGPVLIYEESVFRVVVPWRGGELDLERHYMMTRYSENSKAGMEKLGRLPN